MLILMELDRKDPFEDDYTRYSKSSVMKADMFQALRFVSMIKEVK